MYCCKAQVDKLTLELAAARNAPRMGKAVNMTITQEYVALLKDKAKKSKAKYKELRNELAAVNAQLTASGMVVNKLQWQVK
eukprot:m51a1_g1618 hypothetical protein (81) ;mRNA; f:222547-222936